jgi:hypothetical protein
LRRLLRCQSDRHGYRSWVSSWVESLTGPVTPAPPRR